MNNKKLRLVIFGAGGIGCYYGTRLVEAGHEVIFIARGKHLQAIKDNGLEMRHPDFNYSGAVDACDAEHFFNQYEPENIDAILVCVKATTTRNLARDLKGWFAKTRQGCAIISLQNGIDNEPELAKALGEEHIIGGLAVRIGGHIIEPGVIEATGVAQIIIGPWPSIDGPSNKQYGLLLATLVDAFNEAAIPTRQVDDIRRELWRKLVINNGVNPISALTRLDTHELTQHEEFGPLILEIMRETARVAKADDEELTDKDADEMFELIRTFDSIKTSMHVDLEKGRPLEVEAIPGAVLQRGKKLGIKVPYTQIVYALLKQLVKNP